ncbi:MAG: hypothetical protein KDN04_10005 [Verrucomicrobiae bacterium]|nr:hypothetical protein [Verrucomicrobiae bacterium]
MKKPLEIQVSAHASAGKERVAPARWALLLAMVGAFGLSQTSCSTVSVKANPELVTREGLRSTQVLKKVAGAPLSVLGAFATASSSILEEARQLESKGQHVDAAGCYLKAATEAYGLLENSPEPRGSEAEKALLEIHNRSLARFAEYWVDDPRRFAGDPYRVTCDGETIQFDLAKNSNYPALYFDRGISAESLKGKGVARKTREGCGAAMVGIREQRPERAEEMKFYPLRGLHVPVTLTMESVRKTGAHSRSVILSLKNPMLVTETTIGTRKFPLAADFSAPIAVILNGRNEMSWGLDGFFKADERIKQSGIFLLEPYDPKRIPVLLIHGLISVPIIWRDLVPEFLADPELSRRYQFMVFSYPSSYPVAQSAHLLRTKLADLRTTYDPRGQDPLSRNMVVMGHSMGGILTHTLVADIGDTLWKQFSDAPFDSVPFTPEQKEKAKSLLFFKPDPAVRRAVFIATPHRGANLAKVGLAGTISRIAKMPGDMVRATTGMLQEVPEVKQSLKIPLDKKVTSVQSLLPGAPMVAALDIAPYHKGVIYHSIIGDRGKGNTPNSSDGAVEYWSSHQEGAASELIVPTSHTAYTDPGAIEEMKRILRVHLGSQ